MHAQALHAELMSSAALTCLPIQRTFAHSLHSLNPLCETHTALRWSIAQELKCVCAFAHTYGC